MAVVNHNQCMELVCQIADVFQISDDAVHGENAVSSDEFDSCSCCISLLKFCSQVSHIVVVVTITFCLAETNAVDDAGMVQFVTDDSILSGEDGLKQTAIGIKTGRVKDRVIHSEEG